MKGLKEADKIQKRDELPVTAVREFGDPDLSPKPQKRVFIFLLLVTCVVLLGCAFLLWWVPYVGLNNIHPSLPLFLAIVFGGLVLFGLGGALTLVLTIIRGKKSFF